MFLSLLFYVLSFVSVATTDKVEVLNYTYVEEADHSLAVFNFSKGQNTTDSLTMCTWVKSLKDAVYLFSLQEKSTNLISYLGIYMGQMNGEIYDFKFQTNQTCELLNSWFHLCLRFQGQEINVFLYGRSVPFDNDSPRDDNKQILLDSVIEIGSLEYEEDGWYKYQFVGELYQYNIWNKALSDKEIKKLVKCPSPNMEGDLVAWSKLINAVKNGDKDITKNPRVTTLTEEGPCPTVKKLVCSGNGSGDEIEDDSEEVSGNQASDSYQSGNSDSGMSSGGMGNPGSSSGQSGNSNPGSSPSSSIGDPGSSSGQSGNSNPGSSPSSSTGDPGSSSGQSGNSNPGSS